MLYSQRESRHSPEERPMGSVTHLKSSTTDCRSSEELRFVSVNNQSQNFTIENPLVCNHSWNLKKKSHVRMLL